MTETKKKEAVAYVRSDIAMLSEQTKESERQAYHNRAQASSNAIYVGGLITREELFKLGDEIGAANEKACRQVLAAQNK